MKRSLIFIGGITLTVAALVMVDIYKEDIKNFSLAQDEKVRQCQREQSVINAKLSLPDGATIVKNLGHDWFIVEFDGKKYIFNAYRQMTPID